MTTKYKCFIVDLDKASQNLSKMKPKIFTMCSDWIRGWFGVVKVSCILHHRGVQLILAHSWARLAVLVAGKGRGGMFLFLLFLYFHSCSSFFPVLLFNLLYSSISFLPFSGR